MSATVLQALSVMAVFLPLLASLVAFFIYSVDFAPQRDGVMRHRLGASLVCVLMLLAALSGLVMAVGYHQTDLSVLHVFLADWFQSGALEVTWQLRIDSLSVLMLALVSFIAAWICVYSLGYMRDDETLLRFFLLYGVVYVLDADVGFCGQRPRVVLRLGGRGAVLLSVDWL